MWTLNASFLFLQVLPWQNFINLSHTDFKILEGMKVKEAIRSDTWSLRQVCRVRWVWNQLWTYGSPGWIVFVWVGRVGTQRQAKRASEACAHASDWSLLHVVWDLRNLVDSPDSPRRWQTVCCRWCPPNSRMVFAGKAATFQVAKSYDGRVGHGRACCVVGLSCPSFSTPKDFLRLPGSVGSVRSRIHIRRIHHLTLEFGDFFFFSNFLSLLLTMHSSIASFASFALHSSLLVPFKKTLAVRSFRLQAYHPFQLILRFAFFTLFSAFVSPQVLLSASILASQTYHFFECLNCFRFALSLAALSPAKACVEPGCPNLVGFKSRTRLRFWRSQIFSSLAVLLWLHALYLWSRWFPASCWNLGGADIVSSHRNWIGLPEMGKIGKAGRALLAGLRDALRDSFLQFLFSIVDVMICYDLVYRFTVMLHTCARIASLRSLTS